MEWLVGERLPQGGRTSGKTTSCAAWRALSALPLLIVALASAAMLSVAVPGTIPVAQADGPKFNIIVPRPADKHTEGPVGANVTVHAEGLTASASYTLGYARADVTCAAGFQPFQIQNQNITETASADGKFTATIVWPSDANFVGTTYVICAQDKTQTPAPAPIQSDETFRVDAANAPTIDVATAAEATPGAGTPGTPPLPAGSFYQGGAVTITGHNFVPGGSTLLIAVFATQLQQPADFQSAAQRSLPTVDGGLKVKSQPSGDISATVGLPSSLTPGSYYLYVLSNDGTDQALPSLVASKQITIAPAPTPQPTATTAPTSTPKKGVPPSNGTTPGLHHLKGVLALAGLSVVLFIIGVVALISAAAATPHPERQ